MLDALAGAVIMVVATTSLLFSIEVAEKAFQEAGRYPLNSAERALLVDAFGMSSEDTQQFWKDNLKCSWVQFNESEPIGC